MTVDGKLFWDIACLIFLYPLSQLILWLNKEFEIKKKSVLRIRTLFHCLLALAENLPSFWYQHRRMYWPFALKADQEDLHVPVSMTNLWIFPAQKCLSQGRGTILLNIIMARENIPIFLYLWEGRSLTFQSAS